MKSKTLSLIALSAHWMLLSNTQAARSTTKLTPKTMEELVWSIQNIEVDSSPVARKAATPGNAPQALEMSESMHIAMIGGGLGSRMNLFGEFETELHRRYPKLNLYIRNLCHEGDTPAFRPHPSRNSHIVVPGTEAYLKPEYLGEARSSGHYETPDTWLTRHKIDTVIGYFGYSESFAGAEGLEAYKSELRAFIQYSLKQPYSSKQIQLAIVGPAAFEDLTAEYDLPNGVEENERLFAYTEAMREVCAEEGVLFVDAFEIIKQLYETSENNLTSNGHNLTREGYQKFAPVLADKLFGKASKKDATNYEKVLAAVIEKNRLWYMDYKIPNGVHVHGRRFAPYGDKNYPTEIRKIREMTHIRDKAIWAVNAGEYFDLSEADQKTTKLVTTKTNSDNPVDYKSGKEVEGLLNVAEGFKIELFADETMFPDLQNPSQMAFDNEGRLWVGCMGSYPHYQIGDPEPNDKIIILEDTDGDNKADKQTTFIDNIHIPMGFEITEKGVFVSLGKELVLFNDTDGDGKADKKTAVLSGFDDHDTHHAISSFCADPSGAFFMGEGVFSHSNVETPYGTVRGTNGGFYRYNPNKMRLERTTQINIPNPWGIAVNEWGQNFFLFTSSPAMGWMQQSAIKPKYGRNLKNNDLLSGNRVRPTSGLEIISSRHFPEEMQGDALICNNIGYLGCKQHKLIQDPKTGFFSAEFRQDFFYAPKSYQYFRPVDLEFAPDGSLYFIDWSNVLIGHMQHSARDPKRDHVHGRVYRVTYPSRPLVKPVKVAGASIEDLLENLKEPELRTRYRTRRELRGRDAKAVYAATKAWAKKLDKNHENYDRWLLEALWVTWGINNVDQELVELNLKSNNFNARAAAVRAVRYNTDKVENVKELMMGVANDENSLVRHEALIAATWLGGELGLNMVEAIDKKGTHELFTRPLMKYAKADLSGQFIKSEDPHSKKEPSGVISKTAKEITVQINCVVEGLSFDVDKVVVRPGQKIKVIFNNPDVMQHNFVVIKPRKEDQVALEALQLGAEGFNLNFVPDSDEIIAATKLLNSEEKEVIEFTLTEPGRYAYICSFPGHDRPMRGYFIVR